MGMGMRTACGRERVSGGWRAGGVRHACRAWIGSDLKVLRVEGDDLAHLAERLVRLLELQEADGRAVPRLGVVAARLERLLQVGPRLLPPLGLHGQRAELELGARA